MINMPHNGQNIPEMACPCVQLSSLSRPLPYGQITAAYKWVDNTELPSPSRSPVLIIMSNGCPLPLGTGRKSMPKSLGYGLFYAHLVSTQANFHLEKWRENCLHSPAVSDCSPSAQQAAALSKVIGSLMRAVTSHVWYQPWKRR